MTLVVIVIHVCALAAFVGGPVLAYYAVVPSMIGFGLFVLGGLFGVVGVLSSVAAYFVMGRGLAVYAAIFSAVPVGLIVYLAVQSSGYPVLNDVSTEVVYPPEFTEALKIPENARRSMTFDKELGEKIRKAYPDIQSMAFPEPARDLFDRALTTAQMGMGWTVTLVDGDRLTFEAYDVSPIFRFHDDIVVRVTSAEEDGAVLDIRSKSRDGQGDLGANAKRILAYQRQMARLNRLP